MELSTVYEMVGILSRSNAFYAFLILGVVLIMVDYYFPVDWPAYVGYLCFGLAVFFALMESLFISAIGGLAVFVVMLVMHFTVFSRYLTNAPSVYSSQKRGK
jgi:membrane protein implicated in regulation of membrane protease activity